jgi:hypothetical protein
MSYLREVKIVVVHVSRIEVPLLQNLRMPGIAIEWGCELLMWHEEWSLVNPNRERYERTHAFFGPAVVLNIDL